MQNYSHKIVHSLFLGLAALTPTYDYMGCFSDKSFNTSHFWFNDLYMCHNSLMETEFCAKICDGYYNYFCRFRKISISLFLKIEKWS